MPGGRPSKYDWDDKKEICEKLFVQERRTPREIVKYFAEHFNVPESEIPSARLFRRQFTEKWNFPPRRTQKLSAEEEPVVIERIKQLWEQNLPVATIRSTLEDEGWELGDNEFQRLRKGNGFIRRGTLGAYDIATPKKGGTKKRKRGAAGDDVEDMLAADMEGEAAASAEALFALQQNPPPGLTLEEATRRAQHLAQVQFESDQALANRKRRRRIRGYGHLPPDDPQMGPRYNSETTLDECKAFLHLSNEMYSTVREDYEAICRDMGIERKKTVVENGIWQASKDRLVRENLHLSAMMHPLQPNLDKKAISLDVVCADVTKRMRDSRKKMTLADANNNLGLNPTDSKAIRRAFYDILFADHYTTRLACGDEHWNELRQAWYATSPLLQNVVYEGDSTKLKSVDILCRDACKRYNDDGIRKDPNRRQYQQTLYGPGPGSCKANGGKKTKADETASPAAKAVTKKVGKKVTKIHAKGPDAINIDPALSAAAAEPIPAYFRLSPQSTLIGNHPRLWLGKLADRSVGSLREAATSKAGAAVVTRIQGLIKDDDGSEHSYQIDGDDELEVYLEAAGDKSTFLVVLEGGYA